MSGLTKVLLRAVLAFVSVSSFCLAQGTSVNVELGGIGQDMALDRVRQIVYVSVPSTNEVVKISTVDYSVVDRVIVGSSPRGIDLSIDGTRLFVALFQAGAVAVVDLETNAVEEIVLGDLLGDSRTNDVIEARENDLFVSANPGSNGFAYIVKVSLDDESPPQRVAGNRIIRANPIFEVDPGRDHLYVGEGFSPNSLYKLDLLDENAPIVLEDNHGTVSGTSHLETNPDGSRIYLTSGQVLRTGSFIQAGTVAPGIHQFGSDPATVYIADEPNVIKAYSTTTFLQTDVVTLDCSMQGIRQMIVMPGGFGWLVLGDDLLCGLVFPNPGADDCNENGVADLCDLTCDAQNPITLEMCSDFLDCGQEADCNMDGVPDSCDPDCNNNFVADECDIASGTSLDCDQNGVPDDCQPDCNTNSVADTCDIADGTSNDCTGMTGNGIPDECEMDCNDDGIPDSCDLENGGPNVDCNANQVPDDCDIESGTSGDCNENSVPDECEIGTADCNLNGTLDSCDVASGTSSDCNQNNLPDECDAATADCNANGTPDDCEIQAIHGCCDATFWQGCQSPEIESCVCDIDPYCCTQEWDRICADEVEALACGTCDSITDCNFNGVPDDCENDCNLNDVADECDIVAGFEQDCQADGIPDSCQPDYDSDGIPDDCDDDSDGDGVANELDQCPLTTPGIEVFPNGRPIGDITLDCVTALDDFSLFRICMDLSGPEQYPGFSDCIERFDGDADDDVDLRDYATFARNIAAANP